MLDEDRDRKPFDPRSYEAFERASRGGAKWESVFEEIDPTTRGDMEARLVRRWYERNRETWWERHKPGVFGCDPDRDGSHADEFMLRFMSEVRRVHNLSDNDLSWEVVQTSSRHIAKDADSTP